jgi:hypothetical protein
MGSLVHLEKGASNPEGGSKSPILGKLNEPMNQEIPQRNLQITMG